MPHTRTSARRHPRLRRTASVVGVAVVSLPLVVGAAIVPAEAAVRRTGASHVRTVDAGWYGTPPYATDPFGSSGYGYGYGYDYGSEYDTQTTTTTAATDTTDATAEQSAGLVLVTTTLDNGTAAGTGIVLQSDGVIVTNHHVVEGATSIEVTVAETGETYTATYVGGDATRDIAVLQLDGASGLTTVDTDVSGVEAGDAVTSVGDANGDGGTLTAATGTVTDPRTSITVSDEEDGTSSRLRRLIEIDADIVPGDSGGALLDADGDVVGMNVAASSGAADITGYVIPVARVLRIADAILTGTATGDVELGYDAYLGVGLAAAGASTPTLAGVVVGGPAEAAGLVAGDTVTGLDGTAVTTSAQLRRLIASYDVGDSVTVAWTDAAGTEQSATVELAAAPVA